MNSGIIVAVASLLSLASCHTMMENSNLYDQGSTGYTQTKNEKGETIHVRERPTSAHVPPINYPIRPVYPLPVVSNPAPQTDGSSSANLDALGPKSIHSFLELSRTAGNTHVGVHLGGSANDIFKLTYLSVLSSSD